jgi:hypothetical protein
MMQDDRTATRARACRLLLARVGLEHLWTDEGPTPAARNLLYSISGSEGAGSKAFETTAQHRLFLMTWAIWGEWTEVRFSELFGFDTAIFKAVASLLGAMAEGPDAVAGWTAA